MDLPGANLILASLGLATAAAVAVLSYQRGRFHALGLACALGGAAISWQVLDPFKIQTQVEPSEGKAPVLGATPGYFAIGPEVDAANAPRFTRVSLATPGLDLPARIKAASPGPAWLFLDASEGILPAYRPWIQAEFGAFRELPVSAKESLICWRRSSSFPYASGVCENRPVRFEFTPTDAEDTARTRDGLATVKILKKGGVQTILAGHRFGQNPSREEACLLAVASGKLCAGVELDPGPTLSALALEGKGPIFEDVREEFRLANPAALNGTLTLYQDPEPLAIEPLISSEAPACGGISSAGQLYVPELSTLSQDLSRVQNESQLTERLKELDGAWQCPGLATLELPTLHLPSLKAAYRSAISQLQERPFWLTDARSYRTRFRKVAALRAGLSASQTLWIGSADPLKDLGITVFSPYPFADEALNRIKLSSQQAAWSIYRMGPSAFRISIDRLQSPLGIDLRDFGTWVAGRDPASFHRLVQFGGLASSLAVAFILAGFLALVHGLAIRRFERPRAWVSTLVLVWIIAFVLIWPSYQSAIRPGRGENSLTALENPPSPEHLFLREWPEEWFAHPPQADEALRLARERTARSWQGIWKDARAAAGQTLTKGPEGMIPVTGSVQVVRRLRGDRAVVVWDDPEARNYYFRRTPDYQTAIAGWRLLARTERLSLQISDTPRLAELLTEPSRLVVIPDLARLSGPDLASLQTWVANGGHALFSEKIQNDAPPADITGASADIGPFLARAREAGLGRSTHAYYSRLATGFGPEIDINASQRVLPELANQRAPWWKTVHAGAGRLSFFGLSPVDAQSSAAIIEILARLSGERVQVSETRPTGCATTLLLQPFGDNLERLRSFSGALKKAGIAIRWLVDPTSLAAMMPIWGETFRQYGVVFLDDGQAETREAAAKLWPKIAPGGLHPLFATISNELAEHPPGPESYLFKIRAVTGDADVREWDNACALGAASPRYLPSDVLKGHEATWLEALRNDGPKHYADPTQVAESLETLGQAPAAGSTSPAGLRTIGFSQDDPLKFEEKGGQP